MSGGYEISPDTSRQPAVRTWEKTIAGMITPRQFTLPTQVQIFCGIRKESNDSARQTKMPAKNERRATLGCPR
jgi:hypothetical protein